MKIKKVLVLCLAASGGHLYAKHRKPRPTLTTHWVGDDTTHQLKATYLKENPLFTSFDEQHITAHLLPHGSIAYRRQENQTVESARLSTLAEEAIAELRSGKKKLAHFKILKEFEFNHRKFVGTIVLKYKDYPFVLKLFIENPYSFLHPFEKGFRPYCMAHMTGGMSRYLSGFSRIKNLEATQKFVASHADLPVHIDFPHKWFWFPRNGRWFEVQGIHFKDNKQLTMRLPEVYGIIADEIASDKRIADVRKLYKNGTFQLCKKLNFSIDPNRENFRLEKGTNQLVLIDTENFHGIIGLDHADVDNHPALRRKMIAKGTYDLFFA